MRVFLSYRRDDTAGWVGRLAKELKQRYGDRNVFVDTADLPPAADFPAVLQERLAGCDALLAIIGPRWAHALDAKGQRRLDDPADFVRLEIATALARGILVMPVLVGRAAMPAAAGLPEPLRPLAHRQALELSDERWEYDVGRLLRHLGPSSRRRIVRRLLLASTAVAAFVTVGALGWRSEAIRSWLFPPNQPPVAVAQADRNVDPGEPVRLDASGSHDPEGRPMGYAWSLVERPSGSAASLEGAGTATPTLVPDRAGRYRVELQVTDQGGVVARSGLWVTSPRVAWLPIEAPLVDAARGPGAKADLLLTTTELIELDGQDRLARSLRLPRRAAGLALSGDGRTAVVAHDALLSIVELAPWRSRHLPVPIDVLAVAVAYDASYAYAFPRVDQWVNLHSVELATGRDIASEETIYAGTVGRLAADGTSLYTADNGLSPSDVAKFDVSDGPARYLYDSPYHGEHEFCGDLWPSLDGSRVYTRCGVVLNAAPVHGKDLTYTGRLEHAVWIRSLAELPALRRIVALTAETRDGAAEPVPDRLSVFDMDSLRLLAWAELPDGIVDGRTTPVRGRFVLARDGSPDAIRVLVEPAPWSHDGEKPAVGPAAGARVGLLRYRLAGLTGVPPR